MAGCDAHNVGGNSHASRDRILLMTLVGAVIGAGLGAVFGPAGWALFWTIVFAAAAGAALGFFVGSAVDWFSRLKEHTPRTITISGMPRCAGRNPFGFQPFSDGDWTCNMGALKLVAPPDLAVTAPGASDQTAEVRLRAAPSSGLVQAFPSFNEEDPRNAILHCELSAHAGDYSVAGGAIGSVVGAAVGIGLGLAICAGVALFTFGLGGLVCALVVAILAAAGAIGGGLVGSAVGAVIGYIVDELSDFDKLGKTISTHDNCLLFITGRWVTDKSHEHNEIHDIESVQVVDCGIKIDPPKLHLLNTLGVVGIGRKPADAPVLH